jgi:polyisoprenyl-teichoic acid--peptidoglycan teichoic acid transferase
MTGYPQDPQYDPSAPTWPAPPSEYLAQYQPIRVQRPKRRQPSGCCSCSLALLVSVLVVFVLLGAYFLAPFRTNMLLLGIDRVPDGTALGRSDTMILMSIDPLLPTIRMLSIPRDLWVNIPGVGENRINTAHFFAEANQPGSGPEAAVDTVEQSFGVPVHYYVRLRFDAFLSIVDALGGVTLSLPEDMGGLSAGENHLDGTQALAFVRDRKGTDDFFRMEHTQRMVKAIASEMLSPAAWPRLPQAAQAAFSSVDTNLPAWQWPRLGLALLRGVVGGQINNQTIRREMTTPTITSGGANVLMPDWNQIQPYVQEMFR